MKAQTRVPFHFVLEQLTSKNPLIKPMFGSFGVYIGEKIMIILRNKKKDEDDGIWIATTPEHHAGLKKEFPSMRSIRIFGEGESDWRILPVSADDFESSANRLCELILHNDLRIGKVPKKKKKKNKA